VRDQAIEHGIGGGGPAGANDGQGEPVTEPIRTGPVGPAGPPGPPRRDDTEPGGWRGAVRDHAAFALVLLVGVVGIIRIVEYHWRQGAALLGAALLLAALLRTVLQDRRAGLLVVRGRRIDVLCYAGLGVCVLFVAFTITGGPFG
jgi:hypothetical protein